MPTVYEHAYTWFKNNQDEKEILFLKNNIKIGDHVLDIGANIGFYTKIIATSIGQSGKVYSFEPDTNNFNYLKENTSHLSNVVLNNKAVSSKTEKIKIYTSKELNVDHRTYPVDDYSQVYEIDSIAIDDYFDPNQSIQFIKMDIQGYEIEALKGMKKLIERCKPKVLLEFWPHGIEAAGNTVEDYFSIIKDLGYSIQLLENGKTQTIDLQNIQRFKGQPKELYYNIFLN